LQVSTRVPVAGCGSRRVRVSTPHSIDARIVFLACSCMQARALGLATLPPKRGYLKADMIHTLIERERSQATAEGGYNAARRRAALLKGGKGDVVRALVREFYGEGRSGGQLARPRWRASFSCACLVHVLRPSPRVVRSVCTQARPS
jgi:hypothetical protein